MSSLGGEESILSLTHNYLGSISLINEALFSDHASIDSDEAERVLASIGRKTAPFVTKAGARAN
jgi:hypothetical protein